MKITLDIPETAFSITREKPEHFAQSLRVAAAVKWYELGRISQSKACELIGCSRVEFFRHLHDYAVSPLQLSVEELRAEFNDSNT